MSLGNISVTEEDVATTCTAGQVQHGDIVFLQSEARAYIKGPTYRQDASSSFLED